MTRKLSIAATLAAALVLAACSGLTNPMGEHSFLPLCPAHNAAGTDHSHQPQ